MPDVQEVFHMATQKVRPDPGFVDRQLGRRQRRDRNRRIGAFALVAAIGVIASAVVVSSVATPSQDPATDPTTDEEVAEGFLEAYAAFDSEEALTYLADDANISGLVTSLGAEGLRGTPDELPMFISLLEAMGYEQRLSACIEEAGGSESETNVRCSFAYQLLGSGPMGRVPFTGSHFDVAVRDGEIVSATVHWETERFSSQAWEPFAAWVSRVSPGDAALMYQDDALSAARLSDRAIDLWARRTDDYVRLYAPVGPTPTSGRISRTVNDVSFSLDVTSGGWDQFGSVSINKSMVGPQGAEAIIFWTGFPGDLVAPCANLPSLSGGLTAADLAAAVATAPGIELNGGPSNVTLGGFSAKVVTVTVRDDLGCDPGYFFTWPAPLAGALWTETGVGDTIRLWIVDVDGTLVFIEGETNGDETDGLYREVEQIISTIRFD